MNLKKQAVSGVKWSGVSVGVISALQFITLAILARLLSPTDFGLMGMVLVVVGLSQIFVDMGLSSAIIHRQDTTTEILSSLYWINIGAGIIVFLIIFGITPFIARFYNEPQLKTLMYLGSLNFLIIPIGQQFETLLQKHLQFKKLAIVQVAGSSSNSIMSIILACLGMGVYSLVLGQLFSSIVRVFLLYCYGRKHHRPRMFFSSKHLKDYISFGLYQTGDKFINYFNTNIDYILIGWLLGPKPLGYYFMAYNLVLKPSLLINPILTRVMFPVFARVQEDRDRLKKGYFKALHLLSSINFPIMACLAATAPTAVPFIFGQKWLPSVPLVQILTIVGALRSAGNPIGSLLLARGRADLGFKWNATITLGHIIALYTGAKYGGAIGVAIAFSFMMVIDTVFSYPFLIRSLLGKCLYEYFLSTWCALSNSMIILVVMVGIGIAFSDFPGIFRLIAQVTSGAVLYFALVAFREKSFLDEIRSIVWPVKKTQSVF